MQPQTVLAVLAVLASLDMCRGAKFNGMVYTSWSLSDYSSPVSDASLQALAAMSVDTIELLVTWYQDDISSTSIAPGAYSPTDASLVHAIQTASSLGMRVILKPHVDCTCGTWRGEIGTLFTSEAEWSAWFQSYTAFIVAMAQLSQQNGVAIFNIGTELTATTNRTADWLNVIAAVRSVFTGPLTYGANWGEEPLQIQFWSALDYIGIDAYYPLATVPDPAYSVIVANWAPIMAVMADLSSYWNRSIIFTEIGYRSYALAAVEPFSFTGSGAPDMQAQYNLYQAMLQEVYAQDWFAGVFWWAWETSPYNGGPCDDQYNPCRKPAAQLLSTFYAEHSSSTRVVAPSPVTSSVVVYSNGALGDGWQSWSYSGTYDLQDSTDPYPGHTYSLGALGVAANGAGALSLWHDSVSVDASTVLQLSLRAANASSSISVQLCSCNDCTACGLTAMQVNQFLPASNNCSLPTDAGWTATSVSIPIQFLNLGLSAINRISILNSGTDGLPIDFFVDNIAIVSST